MRKSFFIIVYSYLAVYLLLTNPMGMVSDIKPRMCHSFFYYSYVKQDDYFPSNDIGTIKYREFYYYLFFPIDWLTNSYYGEDQNDEL